MLSRRTLFAFCVVLTVATIARVPSVCADISRSAKLAIVVAKDFPSDDMSFGDLKRLYLGQALVIGGKNVIPIALNKQLPDRVAFDESVLGMDPDTVGLYWVDRKIRGQSGPPKAVETADVLLRVVSRVPGAVGYVRAEAVRGSVKVLRIDGKMPNQPGYRVGK
jgi:hypothetical protein